MEQSARDEKIILWFNRAVRWALGIAFLGIGASNTGQGSWVALSIGSALVISGFFRPKRCLGDTCER